MVKIKYPSPEDLISYNKMVLENIKVKKADQPKILSYARLIESIKSSRISKGNIYHKASVLLENLVRKHPFASGNRRTALASTIKFLLDNNKGVKIRNEATFARVLTGVREGFYSRKETSYWLKNGKIRKFERK